MGQGTMYLSDATPSQTMLGALLEKRAAQAPDQTFFTWQEGAYSHADFNAAVNQMARNLMQAGIVKGRNVAVVMETSLEYFQLWFALAKIGAIEIPINSAYRGDLLAHVLMTSKAAACIIDGKFAAELVEILPQTKTVETIFVLAGKLPGDHGGLEIRDFSDLMAPNDMTNIDADLHYSETGGIIFTSGTTGPSKGVLLSHHYLVAYGLMYAEINGLKSDDVIFNYMPFFHLAAKFLTIATLACGGRMHLEKRLSISNFWDIVRQHGITNFIAVGGVCNMLLSRPAGDDDHNTPIRTIYAVPDPADIHREIEQRFDCRLTTVFGSTEVGLPLFRGVNDSYQPGSCGRESPYYDVKIFDENDAALPPGEVGEIVVRPRTSFLTGSGYVNMPDKTVDSWRNLWMHSGDRGYYDEDGWFYFVDRATDSIRRRGENISSFEVEQLVAKHPAIAEVAAVATPSELGEEEVWVQVILRSGQAIIHEELLLHCEKIMPYFMIPRIIEIVDDFPRTPTAKVAKYKLRKAGPGAGAWDYQENGWKLSNGTLRKIGK